MKSSEARDELVKRVNSTFEKHRTFDSLPIAKGKYDFAVMPNSDAQKDYVAALFSICEDHTVIGRNAAGIAGKRL